MLRKRPVNTSSSQIPISGIETTDGILIHTVMESNIGVSGRVYDTIPDECPICHRGIDARIIKAYVKNVVAISAQIIYQCPRKDCLHFFIGYYKGIPHKEVFHLSHLAPITPKESNFSEIVKSISPHFVEIYNEASYSEELQLSQISGVGYRKALEFLIKDYAILQNPNEGIIKEIKSKWLSEVITEYIENQNIRDVAKLATWLGNDETHYERRWEGKDINDLKNLIELTIRWIEMVEMSKDYKEQMPKPQT